MFYENVLSFASSFHSSSLNSILENLSLNSELLNSNHNIFSNDHVLRKGVDVIYAFNTIHISNTRLPHSANTHVPQLVVTDILSHPTLTPACSEPISTEHNTLLPIRSSRIIYVHLEILNTRGILEVRFLSWEKAQIYH